MITFMSFKDFRNIIFILELCNLLPFNLMCVNTFILLLQYSSRKEKKYSIESPNLNNFYTFEGYLK